MIISLTLDVDNFPTIVRHDTGDKLAPGTSFTEDNFSTDRRVGGGWFRDDSSALHLWCTLFL